MTMTPRLRKLVLTAHIVFSVGWLGAIVPYLALAIAGLTSGDGRMALAAYLSMEMIGWYVIVPFSLAALSTGLVQALGTPWGLFRHWWVLAKFLLTVVAVVILFQHMQDVSRVARTVNETILSSADFRPELIHAAGGLLVVLAVAVLSVFKPWGLTPFGRRRASHADSSPRASNGLTPKPGPAFAFRTLPWGRIIGFHAIGIALLVVIILHLTGGGLRHH